MFYSSLLPNKTLKEWGKKKSPYQTLTESIENESDHYTRAVLSDLVSVSLSLLIWQNWKINSKGSRFGKCHCFVPLACFLLGSWLGRWQFSRSDYTHTIQLYRIMSVHCTIWQYILAFFAFVLHFAILPPSTSFFFFECRNKCSYRLPIFKIWFLKSSLYLFLNNWNLFMNKFKLKSFLFLIFLSL